MNTYYIQNYDQAPDYKNCIPKDIAMNHRKKLHTCEEKFQYISIENRKLKPTQLQLPIWARAYGNSEYKQGNCLKQLQVIFILIG